MPLIRPPVKATSRAVIRVIILGDEAPEGGGLPVPPPGFVFLVDDTGFYLIDDTGFFLIVEE